MLLIFNHLQKVIGKKAGFGFPLRQGRWSGACQTRGVVTSGGKAAGR